MLGSYSSNLYQMCSPKIEHIQNFTLGYTTSSRQKKLTEQFVLKIQGFIQEDIGPENKPFTKFGDLKTDFHKNKKP